MGSVLVSFGLWALACLGALATAFSVAMLLTPGYGDVVIGVFAALAALLTMAAAAGLRRRGRHRRRRESRVVADVGTGQVLEQVAPSRRRWLTITLAAGVLFAGAVAVGVRGAVGALVLAAILGVMTGMSVVQLVPGASWLRVTTRGVMTRHLGHTRAHRWEDVDDFRVYEVSTRYTTQRLIGWSVAEHVRPDRRAARWLRWPHGVDDGLPTEYETDPEELAARLQRYRDGRRNTAASSARPQER